MFCRVNTIVICYLILKINKNCKKNKIYNKKQKRNRLHLFISKELHDLSQINFSRKCLQQKRTKNPSCSSNKPLLYSCITNYLLVGALWTVIPSYILTKIVTFFPWPTDDLFLVPVFYQYNEIRKHYFFSCSYVSPKRSWLLINAAMGRLTKRSRASRWKA